MSDVHAVLLVPAEGDPLGLLADGPCGARPPVANAWPQKLGPKGLKWRSASERIRGIPAARALVLAWDGKPVASGLDLLYRAKDQRSERVAPADWHACEMVDVLWAATEAVAMGLGTLILLDSEDRECPHV